MDDGANPLIGLLALVVLLVLDVIFHGFLTAIEELTDSQIERKVQENHKQVKWITKVVDDPRKTLQIVQIMMTFVNFIVGIYQGNLYAKWLISYLFPEGCPIWGSIVCYILTCLVVVFIIVVFGLLVPQKVATRKPEKWAFSLAGLVHFFVILFTPFGYVADRVSNLLSRFFGVDPHDNVDDVTEEEIISMVNEGQEQGVLEANEAEMIHNIFELGDKEAKDIMTHRRNIVAIDAAMTLSDALDYMLDKINSRFPVYEGDIDNIVGIIHIKDAMMFSRDASLAEHQIGQLESLIRKVHYIPETRNINDLFQTMQSQKMHMVIVVDEYGQTAGIVAMEDILEEIVGNILDEYDEEDNTIIEQSDGSYMFEGIAPLDEVCEILGITFETEVEFDTLNGYLISLIERIPEDDEVFTIEDNGYSFEVLKVQDKMIQQVLVLKNKTC